LPQPTPSRSPLHELLNFNIRADWTDPAQDGAYAEWYRGLWAELRPHTSSTYLNWTDFTIDNRVYPRYGESFAPLVEIKHRYDPDGVFQTPAGIPGSVTEAAATGMGLPQSQIEQLRASGHLISG
jgi:hypothetical protein